MEIEMWSVTGNRRGEWSSVNLGEYLIEGDEESGKLLVVRESNREGMTFALYFRWSEVERSGTARAKLNTHN